MSLRSLFASVLLFANLSSGKVCAQVRIEMPARQFEANEKIKAAVVNDTKYTIVFCVENKVLPQPIRSGADLEWISSPFEVWRKSNHDKWRILFSGIDDAHFSSSQAWDLDPGGTAEYWFRVQQTGRMRLVLEFSSDHENFTDCSDPYQKWKKAKSNVFTVR